MIALMLFAAIIVYIVLSFFILWLAPRFATTAKGKKWAVCIALSIVLWYPVVDPAISYVVYRTYAAQHAGVKIYRTVDNVDRVFLDGLVPGSVSIRENKKAFATDGSERNNMAYDAVEYVGPGGVMYEERFDTGFMGRKVVRDISSTYFVKEETVLTSRYISSDKWTIHNRNGEILAYAQYVYWRGGGPMYLPITTDTHHVYDYLPKNEPSLAMLIHKVLKPRIAK